VRSARSECFAAMRATASDSHRRRGCVLQIVLGAVVSLLGARWLWQDRPADFGVSFTAPSEAARVPASMTDVKAIPESRGFTGRRLLNTREVSVGMGAATGVVGRGRNGGGAGNNQVRMKKYIPLSERHNHPARGLTKKVMKRMPRTEFDEETIMRRIMTVLIKNMGESWRFGPMKTMDIMKEIGLQGSQIKVKTYALRALQSLRGQRMVIQVKGNPKRWELHPEYWEHGVPRVSVDETNPWKHMHLIKFLPYWEQKMKSPGGLRNKVGPLHGKFHPTQQEAMIGIKPGDEWWPPGSKTIAKDAELKQEPGDEAYTR